MESCPSCGKELPGEFPFCPFCGAALTVGAASAPVEERKVVTVLFCDLVGFTAASEVADPEDVRARLRPYHSRVREVLERFGASVEKFVGDAVMAVFGAPVSHEDDGERAVRAALRIVDAIDELNAEDASLSLQVRVGINTGEAVVSVDARPEQGEAFVTGDVVNTASRLQGAAPVNGVAVSEETFRQTERVFEFEALEPVAVKGKVKPLALYRPLRPRARFGSDLTRTHAAPLVGRDLERPLLIGTFERAAQQRSCQLVTVVGEPGVGKSRLCMELFAHLEQRAGLVTWRQGRCLPYGEGIAFWALGEVVKAQCGILESDSPEAAAAKLAQAIPESEPDRPWLLARLAPLVGAPSEPASQEESFTAWRRFLEGLAAERPVVFVFEDLHWADPAMLAFLEHLADWTQDVPLLVLCTARPELYEQHPTWAAGLRNSTTINLAPLSDQDTTQLVSMLLQRAVLPAETQAALLERAGGNPLYAEEFVRLLADKGELGEDVEVPGSVQALIAARLDTLSPERKSLLQDASVMGKVFWSGALAEMGGREPTEVEQALHELARKELVRPSRTSSMAGEAEYGFWHALVRDVCYGQIPRAGRASRHLAAAAWLEAKAGARVDDLADVLAHHYLQALELGRAAGQRDELAELEASAFRYLSLGGERALGLDSERAAQLLTRALDLCPAGHPDRARTLEHWAQAAQQRGRMEEAKEALEEAVGLHRDQGDDLGAGRSLTALTSVLIRIGDPNAQETLTAALAQLEALPPGPELVAARAQEASSRVVRAAYPAAIAAADKAVELAERLGLLQPARALGRRAVARAALGERQGLDEMRYALQLAVDQGEGRTAGVLYNSLASATWLYEGPEVALAVVAEGIAFSRSRGLTENADVMAAARTPYLAETGQSELALAEATALADRLQAAGRIVFIQPRSLQLRLLTEQGSHHLAPDPECLVAAARDSGEPQRLARAVAAAAALQLVRGNHDQARALLAEIDQLPGSRADPIYAAQLPTLVRSALALGERDLAASLAAGLEPLYPLQDHALTATRAQLSEANGNHAEAATLYADAANRWRQFGNVPEQAYALLGHGRSFTALGRPEAEQPLRQAQELFSSLGYGPALAEADRLLDEYQLAAS